MTVGELKELLNRFDDNYKIGFAYDYGDYIHTIAVTEASDIELKRVVWHDGFSTYEIPHTQRKADESVKMVVLK